MATYSIPLGTSSRLVELFSYPNKEGSTEVLPDTIKYWFNQTLVRDGFASQGASARVRVVGGQYSLDLDGPAAMEAYTERIPQFLDNGQRALEIVNELQNAEPDKPWPKWLDLKYPNRIWDPQGTGKWRFFLPFGMAMVNQRALNFFHYPPMRLLDTMRDYLDDPVPQRLVELMMANGMASVEEAWLYSTVMDGAPIAAPDDQGTIYKQGDFRKAAHLIPIQHFHAYQKAQVQLLLNTSTQHSDCTVPIVVYGTPARTTFEDIYGCQISRSKAITLQIIDGKQTAVLASGHPYAFYAQVQAAVGSGSVLPERWNTAVRTMTTDLIVNRWQYVMSQDPAQDPNEVLADCQKYWHDDSNQPTVEALALHQGSLLYPDPNSLQFHFSLSLQAAQERIQDANS